MRGVTDTQLYLAVGLPSALFMLNFLGMLWQSRGLERSFMTRIDSLEKVINARFEAAQQGLLRVEQVIDARLRHLEER